MLAVLLRQLLGTLDERLDADAAVRASQPLMAWIAPPSMGGKPMPKIEPMLASGTVRSTPSSRQRTVSIDIEKIRRSLMSWNGGCSSATGNISARPAQRPVRLPFSS